MEYSQRNGDSKYVLLDLDGTLLENVPIAEVPKNLRRSKDVPPIQRLTALALEPAKLILMMARDRPVDKSIIRFLNAICRNIPLKDFKAVPDEIMPNKYVVDLVKELGKSGEQYSFLVLSHTPTVLIKDYMGKLDVDCEVKGIELEVRGGRVYGFDYSDPFTTLMLTEGGKVAKNYYAAKLLGEGHELEGAIGNTFPEDFPMKDCVKEQFEKYFAGQDGSLPLIDRFEESPVWGLHTPVKGNWRLYTDLSHSQAGEGKLVSQRRPGQILSLIKGHLSEEAPARYVKALEVYK